MQDLLLSILKFLKLYLMVLFGTHRMFAKALGGFYTFIIDFFEILAIGVLLACIIFLIRRNILKIKRFIKHELDGWPRTDANLILITEIILMSLFLTMNTADRALQLQGNPHYADHGNFILSGFFVPVFKNLSFHTLDYNRANLLVAAYYRDFCFFKLSALQQTFSYLTCVSQYLLQAFGAKRENEKYGNCSRRKLNICLILNWLQLTEKHKRKMREAGFGAKDIFDLSWKSLLDAYTCTECGRCTAACPANITGKLLNPRKIMMDTRDRMQDVRKNIKANGAFKDDGKTFYTIILLLKS